MLTVTLCIYFIKLLNEDINSHYPRPAWDKFHSDSGFTDPVSSHQFHICLRCMPGVSSKTLHSQGSQHSPVSAGSCSRLCSSDWWPEWRSREGSCKAMPPQHHHITWCWHGDIIHDVAEHCLFIRWSTSGQCLLISICRLHPSVRFETHLDIDVRLYTLMYTWEAQN